LLGTTGRKGSSAGQFNHPWGITFDHHHQQVIVSESWSHRLQFFSRRVEADVGADGVHRLKHLKSFGSRGEQLGQFKSPAGLCLQPFTHHLLVCDDENHRVQVFSLDAVADAGDEVECKPLYAIGARGDGQASEAKGTLNSPHGVCCDVDGSMAVADTFNHRVQLWDASGRVITSVCSGKEGNGPQDMNRPFDLCYLSPPFSSPSSPASSLLLVAENRNRRLVIWGVSSNHHHHQPISHISVANNARGVR
jgi:tripartite motif-containing protein 71